MSKPLALEELTATLDALQDGLERTPYTEEAEVLAGSYGVYLYHLRRINRQVAQSYIDWMKEYQHNNRAMTRAAGARR